MGRKIIVVGDGEHRTMLDEVPADNEAQLQATLAAHPELLPIEEFGLEGPLLVLGKETSLPSGAADLVGAAKGGELVVAEFKTGPQNPDFRHALAQAIDYGSDLWGMSFDEFESTVATRYFSSDHCPADSPTKGSGSIEAAARAAWGDDVVDQRWSEFVEQVSRRLQNGSFHFVVVAQRLTPAMEQAAEFLNATSAGPAYHLVELIRFTNGSSDAFEGRALTRAPRTRRSAATGEKLDLQRFLDREPLEERRAVLEDFFETCSGLGLVLYWGSTGVSVRVRTADREEPLSIGWVHPSGVTGWSGLRDLVLGFDPNSADQTPTLRVALDEYARRLSELPGADQLSKNIRGVHLAGAAEASNVASIKELISEVVSAAGRS